MPVRTPYNFIPLPHKVAPAQEFRTHDRYYEDCHSGYIDLTLRNETPLFIGGKRSKKDQGQSIEFFRRDGRLCIPGSSYRGMLRTLVEIVSFSKISFVDKDRKLHFRNIRNPKYRNKVSCNIEVTSNEKLVNATTPLAKPGYIIKENGRYILFKSKSFKVDKLSEDTFRCYGDYVNINEDTSRDAPKIYKYKLSGYKDVELDPNTIHDVYFIPTASKAHMHIIRDEQRYLKYALINEKKIALTEKKGYEKGKLIVSGWMFRKHMNWIIGEPTEEEVVLSDLAIENYSNDETRDEGINILDRCKDSLTPCFYITGAEGEAVSIGHTPIQRYAYDRPISDFIPYTDTSSDIAQNIFGSTDASAAGNIYCEDLIILDAEPKVDKKMAKTLASPKPTYFPAYLTQSNSGRFLNDYNSDPKYTSIRGFKQYWHSGQQWKKDPQPNRAGKQDSEIEALTPNHTFKGRLRFDNLSTAELGCLLWVLNLPGQCRYKIGMGKSIGMGTVEIQSDLYLVNRAERYTSVFSADKTEINLAIEKISNCEKYVTAFVDYLRESKILEQSEELDDNNRIKTFLTMMQYYKDDMASEEWVRLCSYMDLKEFKKSNGDREHLLEPEDYINNLR